MNPNSSHTSSVNEALPQYLATYEDLAQHLRGQLEGLSTTEAGEKFAQFVRKLVPQTEIGYEFDTPVLNPRKSNDEGIDLVAEGKDGRSVLYIQAKLWVDRADTIDSVISKFQAYHRTHHSSTQSPQGVLELDEKPVHFMLVTLSRLDGILNRYEAKLFSSKSFYEQRKAEHKISFVHGTRILSVLQAAYRKTSETPANLILNTETEVINKDNVFFGVIASSELKRLYSEFGDALFFENIRDFLGLAPHEQSGRTTPNQEIVKTVVEAPSLMLQRNNGIVIRADGVTYDPFKKQLTLSKGSIVNGCQTTMCLVENAVQECYVPVKIVQTTDSWDVAKAANYQNSVGIIDLDLARHLRPQLAKRVAATSGVRLKDGAESALQIIETIYDRRIAYEETRLLYIGLFSRSPKNLFANNYTELRGDLINKFYEADPYGDQTYETLFALQGASQEGLRDAEARYVNVSYADKFKRFYRDESPSYRCFVTILAVCGATDVNLAERKPDIDAEFVRMQNFFATTQALLQNRRDIYLRYYVLAVKTWMNQVMPADSDDSTIARDMNSQSSRANFNNLYRSLCMDADVDDKLLELKNAGTVTG